MAKKKKTKPPYAKGEWFTHPEHGDYRLERVWHNKQTTGYEAFGVRSPGFLFTYSHTLEMWGVTVNMALDHDDGQKCCHPTLKEAIDEMMKWPR